MNAVEAKRLEQVSSGLAKEPNPVKRRYNSEAQPQKQQGRQSPPFPPVSLGLGGVGQQNISCM